MATINLEISKEKFDAAVPAAKEPKGYIFARMEPFIKEEMELISANLLGDVGIEAANSEPEGRLSKLIISGDINPGDKVTMKYDEEQKQIQWDIDTPD